MCTPYSAHDGVPYALNATDRSSVHFDYPGGKHPSVFPKKYNSISKYRAVQEE